MSLPNVYRVLLDDNTAAVMDRIAAQTGRDVEELIESAAAEAALEWLKRNGTQTPAQKGLDL